MDTRTSDLKVPKLLFRTGAARGKVVALEKERITIGRDRENDIALSDDTISSVHAAIVRDPRGCTWLEDLGSKNGTFMEGSKVSREKLRDGDVFSLCQDGPEVQFLFGMPELPSILEWTTDTFRRTRSLQGALRELLPRRRSDVAGAISLRSLEGVRQILDHQLEESTRRTRFHCLLAGLAFLFAAVIAAGSPIYLRLRGKEESPPASGARIEARLDPIYASLFLSYRDQAIGEVKVENNGDDPLRGLEIQFAFLGDARNLLVEPYSLEVPELGPRQAGAEAISLSIAPKLSTEILSDYTREVTARIALISRGKVLAETSRAVFVYGRNVFNWEKPERVAAFVDPDDPAVVSFVRAVWPRRPPTSGQEFPPPNVVAGLTLLDGIAELALSYLPDARNPIAARLDSKANDRVSYPTQTLLSASGDCDDLAVLCASVLEAAGIPTALAVGSNHVLLLFDAGLAAESLTESAFSAETVVCWRGRIWLPVESTELARPGAHFAAAWAAAWPRREAISSGEMALVELKEAWSKYQPLNPPPSRETEEAVRRKVEPREGFAERVAASLADLRRLFRENLAVRVLEIKKREGEGVGAEHAIGLLYARSGLFSEARRVLELAVFGERAGGPVIDAGRLAEELRPLTEELAGVLLDLAVCLTLGAHAPGDLDSAAVCAEHSLEGFPPQAIVERGTAMLRIALVHRLRGNLGAERGWLDQAFSLQPSLKEEYRSLVAGDGRVAGAEEKIRDYLRTGLR